jgi:nucleotide-binding universal stress UspA family protein
MTTVLIAVDGSESSVEAVATAHRLFGDDADYFVVNVATDSYVPVAIFPSEVGMITPLAMAPLTHPHDAGDEPVGGGDDDLISDVDAAEMIAKQTGEEGGLDHVTALGVVGDPAASIVEVAVAHSVDVIVVGTHERGWLTRLLTSSVADEIRRESPIPVLVVPHPVADHPRRP